MRSLAQQVADRLMRLQWVRILFDAFTSYAEHRAIYMAAAISFYSVIALAPILYLAFWALRRFLGTSEEAQEWLREMLTEYMLPGAADRMVDLLAGMEIGAGGEWIAAVLLLGALVWAAVSFYDALQAIFTVAWGGDPRAFVKRKVHAFVILLGAGALVVATMFLTTALTLLNRGAEDALGVYVTPLTWFVSWLGPYVLSIVVFFLLYKFLPNVFVPWRLALLIAVPVGILWEVSKRVFASATIGSFQIEFYGPVAWLVILMVWIYWSSNIVLLGAEIGAAWQRAQEKYYAETG